jgi:hypothetical protein
MNAAKGLNGAACIIELAAINFLISELNIIISAAIILLIHIFLYKEAPIEWAQEEINS